jgi:hypothetical protein
LIDSALGDELGVDDAATIDSSFKLEVASALYVSKCVLIYYAVTRKRCSNGCHYSLDWTTGLILDPQNCSNESSIHLSGCVGLRISWSVLLFLPQWSDLGYFDRYGCFANTV